MTGYPNVWDLSHYLAAKPELFARGRGPTQFDLRETNLRYGQKTQLVGLIRMVTTARRGLRQPKRLLHACASWRSAFSFKSEDRASNQQGSS